MEEAGRGRGEGEGGGALRIMKLWPRLGSFPRLSLHSTPGLSRLVSSHRSALSPLSLSPLRSSRSTRASLPSPPEPRLCCSSFPGPTSGHLRRPIYGIGQLEPRHLPSFWPGLGFLSPLLSRGQLLPGGFFLLLVSPTPASAGKSQSEILGQNTRCGSEMGTGVQYSKSMARLGTLDDREVSRPGGA